MAGERSMRQTQAMRRVSGGKEDMLTNEGDKQSVESTAAQAAHLSADLSARRRLRNTRNLLGEGVSSLHGVGKEPSREINFRAKVALSTLMVYN